MKATIIHSGQDTTTISVPDKGTMDEKLREVYYQMAESPDSRYRRTISIGEVVELDGKAYRLIGTNPSNFEFDPIWKETITVARKAFLIAAALEYVEMHLTDMNDYHCCSGGCNIGNISVSGEIGPEITSQELQELQL